VREDAPWMWGFHPQNVSLFHGWVGNVYPNLMANNTLKYRKLDVSTREQAQDVWNQPVLWPFGVLVLFSLAVGLGVWRKHQREQVR